MKRKRAERFGVPYEPPKPEPAAASGGGGRPGKVKGKGGAALSAEDAEKAPFGMSNTFRYEAASGATVEGQLRRPGRQRLRLEAAFQAQPAGVPTLLGADEDDKDVEPSVEAPFCVLSVVLV